MFPEYDIIVVGGGHSGCEAAHAAAKMGCKVLLVTMNMQTIGQMSCNPAMGGVAKGQIVREIDALGGMSGIVADLSTIQFRMLNRSKGAAMWSPRTQNDRFRFAEIWRLTLEKNPNIDFWQEMVKEIVVENDQVVGVKTSLDLIIRAKAVILTNGTFLNGLIHIGDKQFGGGRMGERGAKGLTEQLESLGFESGRMKTGTPPRVDGRTLDYSKMEEQKGDENPGKFSYTDTHPVAQQRSCFITYTNPEVHELLKKGFEKSPMFAGRIQGLGPRYCPSIEDKITRFADKQRHQIFVEPEGSDTVEVYVNGFSSSLPEDVQFEALRKIVGFENAKMFRPAYAIEYDFFPPTQLKKTLETKKIENLYFAGQINGTTGYEEAGCQGLMAGINAVKKIRNEQPFILGRSDAYIGVLIDDLITKGTNEPYRMFTSRAEYRILLRQDNADLRLTPLAYELGLVDQSRVQKVKEKEGKTTLLIKQLKKFKFQPNAINDRLTEINSAAIREKQAVYKLLKRPDVTIDDLLNVDPTFDELIQAQPKQVVEQTSIQIKYEMYIQKEQEMVEKTQKLENHRIPESFNYDLVKALSAEAREKLKKYRPTTIGEASRISGVSPADISILIVYMKR